MIRAPSWPHDGARAAGGGLRRASLSGRPAQAWRIVIFLSLGTARAARAGRRAGDVRAKRQRAVTASIEPRAAHNAGHRLGLDTAGGPVLVIRPAAGWRGASPRRWSGTVAAGRQRIGRILLGSRAEVFFKRGGRGARAPGEQVRAGETVLATWGEADGRA